MRTSLLIALSSFALLGSAAYAADANSLSFRHMEAQQPRDPLLTSSVEEAFPQHTSARRLAAATSALQTAIPAGTDRAIAEAILRKAGAHCHPANGTAETCSYFDVQTRDEFVDAVNWDVTLNLDHDHVSGLSVDRTWRRS